MVLMSVKKRTEERRKEKEKKGMSIQATSIYVVMKAEKVFHFALCKSMLPFVEPG